MLIDRYAAGVVVALTALALLLGPASAEAAFGPLGQDQRLSFMGPNGDAAYEAFSTDVAYNPSADEYLVVWAGDDNTPPLVNNELEIFAQRLSGSGVPLGGRIRVSAQGMDGNVNSGAGAPAVAYNPASDEYLVVWLGEIGTTDDYEVWARRLSATGVRIGGADDFQISANQDDQGYAATPGIAVNAVTGDYLVTWVGTLGTTPPLEDEIFGQRLTAAGAATGADDFRISEQGADGNASSQVFGPTVTSNPVTGDFLVAWAGEIGTTDEFEIWAQRLASNGSEAGGNDFQVSDMGGASQGAFIPRVAANPGSNEYLVVWLADDNVPPLVDNELEVFGQRLTASGGATGADDFRISTQGADGNTASEVSYPSVTYDSGASEYLVAWQGEIGTSNEFQIWAQRLSPDGAETGGSNFQVSNVMGPGWDSGFDFLLGSTAATANSRMGEFFVVWEGVDSGEQEIFGRRLGVFPPTLVATDPLGPANDNNPLLKGSVSADSVVDVFTNSSCAAPPAVNDAPAGDLNGAGIPVAVADNAVTSLSATASSDGRTSRCSNSLAYSEQTPSTGGGGGGGPLAFGARTLVTLKLAARRVPARGPLRVRVTNGNAFAVRGRLSGRTATRVSASRRRRVKLRARSFDLGARSGATVKLALPRTLRGLLQRRGKLALRLTARVVDPAGNERTVAKRVAPRLKGTRRR